MERQKGQKNIGTKGKQKKFLRKGTLVPCEMDRLFNEKKSLRIYSWCSTLKPSYKSPVLTIEVNDNRSTNFEGDL